ncbi:MAG: thylakoid membrane photosystem I accumulation factor [Cyanobacteria bacterium]|nr:thylakoid membrane photosystem I accumulation factor [Cyanobacteriota bacterium]
MKQLRMRTWMGRLAIAIAMVVMGWLSLSGTAWAGLDDDHFDGNIFALYAGNGSLVPPRVTLSQSLQQDRPALLVFYVDDSADCKRFASVISQLQAPYGRVATFIPVMADAIPVRDSYEPTEPGYYFKGVVPQTVVVDGAGTVRLDEAGLVSYEAIDDVMRELFDLLPRSESVELRRRPINEVNGELVGDV